jgi:putative tryptophan/tyrosine transport system substrate-binding protein
VKRRAFIAGLGGTAVASAWPPAVRAQAKLPTIGFVGANTAEIQKPLTDAFVQRLRELGWIENRTVVIEYRWAEGQASRSPGLMADLVRRNVDVIVTHATPNVVAAKGATSTIPIVFAAVGDPVANRLVASLSQPGGNITGLSLQQAELAGKRLELLREIVPGCQRLAMLVEAANTNSLLEADEVQTAAKTFRIEVERVAIHSLDEIPAVLNSLTGRAQAIYIPQTPLLNVGRARIVRLAVEAAIPTIHSAREFVEAGGLVSYGPNFADLFRRAGEYVNKILRGAKPADIPVEQPTKFDLIFNLRTAKALGLTLPLTLLARADEVIE